MGNQFLLRAQHQAAVVVPVEADPAPWGLPTGYPWLESAALPLPAGLHCPAG